MMFARRTYIFEMIVVISYIGLQFVGAEKTDPSEVRALEAIKRSLVDPMSNLGSWGSGDPCTSHWTGVICEDVDDGYMHVDKLLLLKLNLSGNLAPEVCLLHHLKILDIMWNNIAGSIPKEIGNLTSLRLLLLSGNQLSGSLPEEIGYLPRLDRIQIDENQISGPIPKSFANLNTTRHFHMNNNSLSGQIPTELSRLPSVLHLLLDNNNLSGHLPPELSRLQTLKILQLDNNNFSSSSIPASYRNISTLTKLSLRNCSLQGAIPDLSSIPHLQYIDLSWNQLKGPIPSNKLSNNITTIDLSGNLINGSIPSNFSGFPYLQRMSLKNNLLLGVVPLTIWQNIDFHGNSSLILDFQNNNLSSVSGDIRPPQNVTLSLYGNPVCASGNSSYLLQFCEPLVITQASGSSTNSKLSCEPCPTDLDFENNPFSLLSCFCAVPIRVGIRLKSPGISDFRPYAGNFEAFLTSHLQLQLYQLYIQSFFWEEGPRLRMNLKFFPDNVNLFNTSEILRIRDMFTEWQITLPETFGPYELLNFTLGSYANFIHDTPASRLKKNAVVGIALGAFAGAAALSALVAVIIIRAHRKSSMGSRRHSKSKMSIKIDGVKRFTFKEMALATKDFNDSTKVGQGGYGNVYRGTLADGAVVAIKRAHAESLQGSREFCTEIELLSRLHHRNLVSLVGYCDEGDEQMLVYEFMPNGTLRDHLSYKSEKSLNFSMRLRIALGSARAILYLHREADPPIFHRDIKASNILLDSRFIAKVADFGLSRLAPALECEGTSTDYVSTVVKGTPGYLDPEYFKTHKLTDKSDVYSLGVVFLELLTGMKPIQHGKNLVREVSMRKGSDAKSSIIDSRMGSYPSECIDRFMSLALRCCQEKTDARPTMQEVVRELEIILDMMAESDSTPSESIVTDSTNSFSQSSKNEGRTSSISGSISNADINSISSKVIPR